MNGDRVERLSAAKASTFVVADARSAQAQSALSAYFAELDEIFPAGFDSGDALARDAELFDPPHGSFLVVHDRSDVIGCGGILSIDARIGEIKRMWIAPGWRGCGLASRLLAELEERSRSIGHAIVRLDTNASLKTAINLYERSGFQTVDRYNDNPYAHRWFEKRLTS